MNEHTSTSGCVVKACNLDASDGLVCDQHGRMYDYNRDGMPLADAAALAAIAELADPTEEIPA